MTSASNKDMKRWAVLFAVVALYFVIDFLPCPEGLEIVGKRALAVMICTTILWVTAVLPMGISALMALMLCPVLGITTLPDVVDRFAEPVFFFFVASYIIANGLTVTGLDRRITLMMAVVSNGDPKKLLFVFMMGASLISAILSDIAVVLMTMPVALMLLNATGCNPGTSRYGKAVMIGIALAALIGGMGTPAGSSTNVMALSVLESAAGVKVEFLQWTILAMPIVLLVTPLAYFVLINWFKPEITKLEGIENAREELAALGALSLQEKKYIAIMAITLVVWITESIHGMGIPITSTLAAVTFFLPGINLMTWNETKGSIMWDVILVINVCTALGNLIWTTGAAGWIAGGVSGIFGGLSLAVMLIVLGLIVVFGHLICPVNPALVSILIPIACGIAAAQGINPAVLAIPVGFMVSCACLIPLDAITLITYGTGYYKMQEMFLPGLAISIGWVLIATVVMLILPPMMGLM